MSTTRVQQQQRNLHERIVALRNEIAHLRELRQPTADDWMKVLKNKEFSPVEALKMRAGVTNAKGGPITNLEFGNELNLLTMTTGAKAPAIMLVWDINTSDQTHLVDPKSSWMMTCKMEQTKGDLLGCGGINCQFMIYNLAGKSIVERPDSILEGHESYISGATFIQQNRIVTAGGDGDLKYWDTGRGSALTTFQGHTSDVLCLDKHPSNHDIFISGACDFTARQWDQRERNKPNSPSGLVYTFDTKSRDVQGISYFPDGQAFAVALSNSQIQLYDIRSSCKLATITHPEIRDKQNAKQVIFSASGRLLFARYDAGKAFVYDVTKASPPQGGSNMNGNYDGVEGYAGLDTFVQRFHSENPRIKGLHVSCMAMQPQGRCLAVGDEKELDTVAKLFWPKEQRKRR